jgi:hypothetical protein
MSTSTDLRDRPGDKDSAQSTKATATGLTIVSAGFTLYPTRMEKELVALGVAALEADGHTTRLVVHKDSLVGKSPKEVIPDKQGSREQDSLERAFPELHFLNVAGFDLSSPDGQKGEGATAINFDMIPDFESLSSGVHLAGNWRKRIHSWMAFDEGQVVAVPDQYSFTQTCEWTDFDHPPQHHRPQLLTSCTAYARSVQNSQSIVLTSRKDTTKRLSLEFKDGPVFAAFINFAAGADARDYTVDFSHINAMLRLSDSEGVEVRFTLGKMKQMELPTVDRQDRGWPEWLTKLLEKNDALVGRPHCGARQMRVPD